MSPNDEFREMEFHAYFNQKSMYLALYYETKRLSKKGQNVLLSKNKPKHHFHTRKKYEMYIWQTVLQLIVINVVSIRCAAHNVNVLI